MQKVLARGGFLAHTLAMQTVDKLRNELVGIYGEDMVADFEDFCHLTEKLRLLAKGEYYESVYEIGEECEQEL